MAALFHLIEYLEKHPSYKLDYYKGPMNVTGLDGYCDADWGTSDSRRSISGNIFGTTELLSNGNPSSRNQWHSLPLRLNIIRHCSERQRSSIIVSC